MSSMNDFPALLICHYRPCLFLTSLSHLCSSKSLCLLSNLVFVCSLHLPDFPPFFPLWFLKERITDLWEYKHGFNSFGIHIHILLWATLSFIPGNNLCSLKFLFGIVCLAAEWSKSDQISSAQRICPSIHPSIRMNNLIYSLFIIYNSIRNFKKLLSFHPASTGPLPVVLLMSSWGQRSAATCHLLSCKMSQRCSKTLRCDTLAALAF